MIRIVDPGSGSGFFTHPGSRIQGSKRQRILDLDPQHCRRVWFGSRIRIRNIAGEYDLDPGSGSATLPESMILTPDPDPQHCLRVCFWPLIRIHNTCLRVWFWSPFRILQSFQADVHLRGGIRLPGMGDAGEDLPDPPPLVWFCRLLVQYTPDSLILQSFHTLMYTSPVEFDFLG